MTTNRRTQFVLLVSVERSQMQPTRDPAWHGRSVQTISGRQHRVDRVIEIVNLYRPVNHHKQFSRLQLLHLIRNALSVADVDRGNLPQNTTPLHKSVEQSPRVPLRSISCLHRHRRRTGSVIAFRNAKLVKYKLSLQPPRLTGCALGFVIHVARARTKSVLVSQRQVRQRSVQCVSSVGQARMLLHPVPRRLIANAADCRHSRSQLRTLHQHLKYQQQRAGRFCCSRVKVKVYFCKVLW